MKTKKLALAGFLLLAFFLTKAQDEIAFKVLVNKGKTEVKAGSSWQAIKVGSSLKSTDEINVHENSYVGLVHINGKPIELKKPGKYSVAKLSSQVGPGTSVLNKYTDFILSSNTTKKNSLTATGAVHRGDELTVLLPVNEKNPIIFGNEITVTWEKGKSDGPYEVLLFTMFGDELYKTKTSDTKININLADKALANEDNILIKVTPMKGSPSATFTLKKLSVADKERIKTEFTQISGEVKDSTAFGKYIEAGFFEKNGLLIDATTAFLQAVELEPALREDYNAYLLRTGLKQPPPEK